MRIYFIRHEDTGFGARLRFQYRESPLSQKGHMRTEVLALRLSILPAVKVYSSDYERAIETAEALARPHGVQPEVQKLFYEKYNSTEVQGKPFLSIAVFRLLWSIIASIWNPDHRFRDEENMHDLFKRVEQSRGFLEMHDDSGTVFVVSHRMYIAAFISLIKNPRMWHGVRVISVLVRALMMRHGGVTSVEYTKEKGWRVLKYHKK